MTRLGLRELDLNPPFARLALTHLLSVAGDTLVAFALAGSLFFGVQPGEDRGRVALYLLFTMAPFALVGPFIGPLMDRIRGGHRAVIIATGAGRVVVALAMVGPLSTDSLLLFPMAFLMLVLAKAYHVARAAVVPTTVPDDPSLVEANAKLQLISALGGLLAGIPGAVLFLIGPGPTVAAAGFVFVAMVVAALRIPPTTVTEGAVDEEGEHELRGAGIRVASTAMGLLRWDVGFVTFLLAFALRGGGTPPAGSVAGRAVGAVADGGRPVVGDVVEPVGPPTWHFAVVSALLISGGLVGAWAAPRLRRQLAVEQMLALALALATAGGLFGLVLGGLLGNSLLALLVLMAATTGKQAFDALVQRDAPDANRGRSFGRFETRFQVVWVVGALLATVIHLPPRLGSLAVAVLTGVALAGYLMAVRAIAAGREPRRPLDEVKQGVAEAAAERRRRRRS